jgi:hypothetical protein
MEDIGLVVVVVVDEVRWAGRESRRDLGTILRACRIVCIVSIV